MKNTIVAILSVMALSACQSVPPLSFSVPNVGVSKHKIDADAKSMTVTVARPDEQVGNIRAGVGGGTVPQLWQTSLIEALNRMTIFQDDSPKKVNISVKITRFELSFGRYDCSARYEIIDRKTGDIIFTQDISSVGEDNSVVGATRITNAVNRAVQNNISLFLQALETVDANKPMFPVKKVVNSK